MISFARHFVCCMCWALWSFAVIGVGISVVVAYNPVSLLSVPAATSSTTCRRTLLVGLLTAASTVTTTTSRVSAVNAQEEITVSPTGLQQSIPTMQQVYFGVGCFWHIQHELIQAERELLQRTPQQYTALTGYAGGTAIGSEGRVCYHNLQRVADYGALGHGEVVGLELPENYIVAFAKVYFTLFDPKTGNRVDPQDRGSEYRSLLGLPGGITHPVYPAVQAAAQEAGFVLKEGRGNDPDTLNQKLVYVYDTTTFPFYQAEVYHQYHNDFQSLPYGKEYNKLAEIAFEEGRIKRTGCPDKV